MRLIDFQPVVDIRNFQLVAHVHQYQNESSDEAQTEVPDLLALNQLGNSSRALSLESS